MEKCQRLGLVLSSSSAQTPAFTVDEFNRHVTGCHQQAAGGTAGGGLDFSQGVPASRIKFRIRNVEQIEVISAVREVKSGAIGLDEIPLKFIKLILPAILPHVTHIVNFAITSCSYPSFGNTQRSYQYIRGPNRLMLTTIGLLTSFPPYRRYSKFCYESRSRSFSLSMTCYQQCSQVSDGRIA